MHYSIMAIGAHADDIELNFGATLAKYMELHNYAIHYIMSTNNMSGSWCKLNDDGSVEAVAVPYDKNMRRRKLEADAAAKECYAAEAIHLDHPQRHYTNADLRLVDLRFGNPPPDDIAQNVPTIITAPEDKVSVEKLTALILSINPKVIFTHAAVDPNPEHTCTAWLTVRAFKKAREQGFGGSLLLAAGRHASEAGEFFAGFDTFIDVSDWMAHKIRALSIHQCQSAGIFAEKCCADSYESGRMAGVTAAEIFIVHCLNRLNYDPLTVELYNNMEKKKIRNS